MILWPGNQIDRKWTINQARGCIGRIADRFDLTVECERRHYEGDTTHPLADVFGRYRDFFDLFGSFAGYVDFWLLDDLVGADGGVRIFLPSEDFTLPAIPRSLAGLASRRADGRPVHAELRGRRPADRVAYDGRRCWNRRVIDARAIDDERQLFATTLESVGPDAPTNAGNWTAHDVAAHVVSLDRLAGVATFLGRMLVAHRLRLNDLARRRPQLSQRAIDSEKKQGFEAVVAQLRQPPPWLLIRRPVRAVGLFEVWAHHEDVRRPNGLEREHHPDLDDVIEWLRRYSRIDRVPDGPPHEVAYWLAGREGGPRPI